jgi:hypothetical protein
MTKTQTDLVNRALEELGVVAAGQTPSDEDVEGVRARVATMLEDLSERDIIYIEDSNEIPNEMFDDLGIILADRCKAKYGQAGDRGFESAKLIAEGNIKVKTRNRPNYRTLETKYY